MTIDIQITNILEAALWFYLGARPYRVERFTRDSVVFYFRVKKGEHGECSDILKNPESTLQLAPFAFCIAELNSNADTLMRMRQHVRKS